MRVPGSFKLVFGLASSSKARWYQALRTDYIFYRFEIEPQFSLFVYDCTLMIYAVAHTRKGPW